MTSVAASPTRAAPGARGLAQTLAELTRRLRDRLRLAATGGADVPGLARLGSLVRVATPAAGPDEVADQVAQALVYALFAMRCDEAGQPFGLARARAALMGGPPALGALAELLMATPLGPIVEELVSLLAGIDATAVLADVRRRTPGVDPALAFYEELLAALDPAGRAARGVYVTPAPVVAFIARSVDRLLRDEFGLADGLAGATPMRVLDPACGAGAFLLPFARAMGLPRPPGPAQGHAPRLVGYELLLAPLVVAHLRLAALTPDGAPAASGIDLRLADALTLPVDDSGDPPVLVVVGNPPYAGHPVGRRDAGDGRSARIDRLLDDYRRFDGEPLGEATTKWLGDDYVRFIRYGAWRIERAGAGVLAVVTNHGYLDNPTFRGMRRHLLRTFDAIYALDLHGDRKRRETAPDGGRDENLFPIQKGVALGLFVKTGRPAGQARLFHADLFGRRAVVASTPTGPAVVGGKLGWLQRHDVATAAWTPTAPAAPAFSFRPRAPAEADYARAWRLTDVFPVHSLGILTKRDRLAVAFTAAELMERLQRFLDPALTDEACAVAFGLPVRDRDRWDLAAARSALRGRLAAAVVRPILYRPFDERAVYLDDRLVARPNRRVLRHLERPNRALVALRQGQATPGAWSGVFVAQRATDQNLFARGGGTVFPLYRTLPDGERGPNLAPAFATEQAARLGLRFEPRGPGDLVATVGPEDLFHATYALLHAPSYRRRHAEALRDDFPRLTLPTELDRFRALAALGAELVEAHLLARPHTGRVEFGAEAAVGAVVAGGYPRFRPPDAGSDGRAGAGGSRIEIGPGDRRRGVPAPGVSGVPAAVWAFRVGGHQVAWKWLADRRGRPLTAADLARYQAILAALAETLRLMERIDGALA